ncbi:MAG: response regulator [Myxococcota bacterium]
MSMGWEGATMLLVDDDDVFREQLGRAMRRRGFETHQAPSGEEAIELARRLMEDRGLDVAIVDLRMPGMSGLEVVDALHRLAPQAVVAMLTGYGSIATTVDAMRLGAATYVSKPADADDILHAIERAMHNPLEEKEPTYEEAPSLARAEWEHINRVLADCNGNITQAAKMLGIHRRSLQRKLQKYPPKT